MKQLEQQVHITNTNVTKGKGAFVLGAGLIFLGVSMPVIGAVNEFSSKVSSVHNSFIFKDANSALIPAGIIFGIGAVISVYGRIKHWYYNDRL
jgi:hypothetical protein